MIKNQNSDVFTAAANSFGPYAAPATVSYGNCNLLTDVFNVKHAVAAPDPIVPDGTSGHDTLMLVDEPTLVIQEEAEDGFSDSERAEADSLWALPLEIKKGTFGYTDMPLDQFLALHESVANVRTDRNGNRRDSPDVYEAGLNGMFRTNKDSRPWVYNGTHWCVLEAVEAEAATAKLIKHIGGSLKDLDKAISVNKLVVALADYLPSPETGINVRNGFLTMGEGGRWQRQQHDPDNGQVYCLPFNYDPKAKCDRWLSFLKEVQPDLAVRRYLQDIVGYILLGSDRPRAEMFFVLQGTGSNGKSVFLDSIKALVGEENYSTLAMNDFTGKNLESLIGKIANIGSETERADSMQTSVFKQAVSGEPVLAEPKYRAHYSFVSHAALVFAINEMPSVDEKTDGIWRRMKLIQWPVTIGDDKKDLSLSSKLKQELPGILRWALAGASRVARRGKLVEPVSVTAAVKRVRIENNNIATFIEECAKVEEKARISKQDAYLAYSRWAKVGGFKAASKTNFGREVTRILKLTGSVKVPERYRDINGIQISGRPDAYPFWIPEDFIPAFEGANVTGYRAVGMPMG